MKILKRMIYSFCVLSTTSLLLWSCANDYARTDITLEMTDEDSVDAIIDHDLLTVGGTIINIEEPQESHTPVVEYIDEVDITTPEFEEEDISIDVAESEPDKETELPSFFDEDETDVMESVEIDESIISEDLDVIGTAKIDETIVSEKPDVIESVNTDEISISDGLGSSADLEEVDLDERIKDLKETKIYDEPMKLDEIVADETKEVDKGFSIPSDEEVTELRTEVDALINKQGTKKSLDEFVSPVYNDKRIKVSYPTHTVKRGDTLWEIGRKYGCSISELCAANNLSRRKVLSIGQTLTIPISKVGSDKPKALTESVNTASSDLEMPPPVIEKPKVRKSSYGVTEEYTVQKGDSYWKIARKYGVNSPELMRINNTTSTLIKPGQKIKVPKK